MPHGRPSGTHTRPRRGTNSFSCSFHTGVIHQAVNSRTSADGRPSGGRWYSGRVRHPLLLLPRIRTCHEMLATLEESVRRESLPASGQRCAPHQPANPPPTWNADPTTDTHSCSRCSPPVAQPCRRARPRPPHHPTQTTPSVLTSSEDQVRGRQGAAGGPTSSLGVTASDWRCLARLTLSVQLDPTPSGGRSPHYTASSSFISFPHYYN